MLKGIGTERARNRNLKLLYYMLLTNFFRPGPLNIFFKAITSTCAEGKEGGGGRGWLVKDGIHVGGRGFSEEKGRTSEVLLTRNPDVRPAGLVWEGHGRTDKRKE